MITLYEEAIADAKKLKEVAEQNAKNAIISSITPVIKQMIEKEIVESVFPSILEVSEPPVTQVAMAKDLPSSNSTENDAPVKVKGKKETANAGGVVGATEPVGEGAANPGKELPPVNPLPITTESKYNTFKIKLESLKNKIKINLSESMDAFAERYLTEELFKLYETIEEIKNENIEKIPTKILSLQEQQLEYLYKKLKESKLETNYNRNINKKGNVNMGLKQFTKSLLEDADAAFNDAGDMKVKNADDKNGEKATKHAMSLTKPNVDTSDEPRVPKVSVEEKMWEEELNRLEAELKESMEEEDLDEAKDDEDLDEAKRDDDDDDDLDEMNVPLSKHAGLPKGAKDMDEAKEDDDEDDLDEAKKDDEDEDLDESHGMNAKGKFMQAAQSKPKDEAKDLDELDAEHVYEVNDEELEEALRSLKKENKRAALAKEIRALQEKYESLEQSEEEELDECMEDESMSAEDEAKKLIKGDEDEDLDEHGDGDVAVKDAGDRKDIFIHLDLSGLDDNDEIEVVGDDDDMDMGMGGTADHLALTGKEDDVDVDDELGLELDLDEDEDLDESDLDQSEEELDESEEDLDESDDLDEMGTRTPMRSAMREGKKPVRKESASKKSNKEVNDLKVQLAENQLFTAKVVYLNKFLQGTNLSSKQKQTIVEYLDNAQTIAEAREIYNRIKKALNESVRASGSSSKPTKSGSANVETLNEGTISPSRWQRMAGIKVKG